MNTAVLQIVMAGIGAMGFSVLFNIRGYKVVLCSIGGALAWSVYLICVENGMEIFTALFVAAIAAADSSELLARVVKAPVLLFLVPILIPLIPGSDLYYMMSFLCWRNIGISVGMCNGFSLRQGQLRWESFVLNHL